MIKPLIACLSIAAATLTPVTSAQASRDFYYEGVLSVSGTTLATYRTPLTSSVYKPMADAQQTVMASLRGLLVPKLKDSLASVAGYQSGYATINGPMTLTYRNGEMTVSGLQVSLGATVKRSFGPLVGSCTVDLALDPATTIVGQLDFLSGTLTAKEIRGFKLQSRYVSCETNFDWVPLVGDLLDAAGEHFVDQLIETGLQDAYNAIGNLDGLKPVKFMGLDAIPDSAFGSAGLQLAQLKNQIASGFQNLPLLTVQFGDPKRRVYGPQGYPHEAGSHDLIMGIGVGNLYFELGEHRIYYDEMYCPPASTGRSCIPF
ncbi:MULTISPECIES: hypothetical protein [Roseateles]|uniref:Uncharacterized protein n=1 Tax=Pelomonas caseinilytica TaxID=2906763 RepID=A0ABS8XHY9_9BURK|nr:MULTISPECIES: hypothetical protein [unclassified Roseateles]MCE4539167.1 hypothetical protein [Pelomonas sp. P7]HEV6964027.1 hypothetical protein [Roseateles sp.]